MAAFISWIGEVLCRAGIHRRYIVRDTGVTLYWRCTRCGERFAGRKPGTTGHQPIDYHWLETGEFTEWPYWYAR